MDRYLTFFLACTINLMIVERCPAQVMPGQSSLFDLPSVESRFKQRESRFLMNVLSPLVEAGAEESGPATVQADPSDLPLKPALVLPLFDPEGHLGQAPGTALLQSLPATSRPNTVLRTGVRPQPGPLPSLTSPFTTSGGNWEPAPEREPVANPSAAVIQTASGIAVGMQSQSSVAGERNTAEAGPPLAIGEIGPPVGQSGSVAAATSPGTPAPPAVGTVATVADGSAASSPTVALAELIAARTAEIEAAGLDEESKKTATAHLQKAADFLKRTGETHARVLHFQTQIQSAPQQLETLRQQLKDELTAPSAAVSSASHELENLLATEKAILSKLQEQIDRLDAEAKLRSERRPELANKLEEAKKNLAKIELALKENVPSADPVAVQLARKTEQEVSASLYRQQIQLFPLEQSFYNALSDVFLAEKDLAIRLRKHQQAIVESFETAVTRARQRELAEQAAEARRALQNAHPALKDLAEKNSVLTQKRSEYLAAISQLAGELEELRRLSSRIEEKFEDAIAKEKRTGLTTSIGLYLRNEKLHLPHAHRYEQDLKTSEHELIRLQSELIEFEEEREQLGDLDDEMQALLADIRRAGPGGQQLSELEEMTRTLLEDRRKYLNDLMGDLEICLAHRGDLSAQQKSFAETLVRFRSHIDERILWIRSAEFFDLATLQRTGKATADLFAPRKWHEVYERLLQTVQAYPVSAAGIAIICLLLVALQGNFRQRLLKSSSADPTSIHPRLSSTLWAILLTGLITCVWPFMMWMMGRQLALSSGIEDFSYSLGRALQITGLVFASIELFRQFCRPRGVAECHLHWPENTVRGLHGYLVGLLVIGLPLVFTLELANLWKEGQWAESLGRVAFIAAMIWFSICLQRMLQPSGPIFQDVVDKHPQPAFHRMLQTGYLTAVVAPLLLAGLAVWGYHYTAEQLFIRLEMTMWLSIILVVVYSLISNSIERAQVHLNEIRQKLQAKVVLARRYRKQKIDAHDIEEAADPLLDGKVLADQIQKIVLAAGCLLFMVGLWTIWAEVLPALQRINGIQLWHVTQQVTQVIESESGNQLVPTNQSVPITLGHLILSIGLLVVTTIAAGNIPGLLELAILRRLPLDKGGRNAITTLTRYAISVVGGVSAAQSIGIQWSSVQWLVAALTVGLGFGLQEIFANFVSGLIILFERPVRIGDTVTIDGVTGTVSKIQIRATTIRDFDRKEYLVPNKEFVTGRLLNWTLSDQINRITINVGVAYGSDTDLARELMLKVAQRHPKIMRDPAPMTSFESFGDSALNLVLRCFLPDLDDRLKVVTELHTGINREFKQSGIEIPFPQMDLHVKQIATPAAAVSQQNDLPDQAAA